MDKFIDFTEDIKELFRGWNAKYSVCYDEETRVGSFLIRVKDQCVTEDRIHITYCNGQFKGFINGKPTTTIKKSIMEYKEKCLCNSKSILV